MRAAEMPWPGWVITGLAAGASAADRRPADASRETSRRIFIGGSGNLGWIPRGEASAELPGCAGLRRISLDRDAGVVTRPDPVGPPAFHAGRHEEVLRVEIKRN